MPKIIHAAGLRLDSVFADLPLEKSRELRRESWDLPDRLAELALREQAELVLLSGDLFDGERVYPEAVEQLKAALARMGCPVFIAPGARDPYTPYSPYALQPWPDNVCIFRESELAAAALEDLRCVVYGAAFTGPERTGSPIDGWTAPEDGMTHIYCLYGDVMDPESKTGPLTKEQIARSGADYVALGHSRPYSGLQREGDAFWAYPGCPEGHGFHEAGDRGVLVGTVEHGKAEMEFVPLCRRRYWNLEADVTGTSPEEALERVMPDTAEKDVCRIVFTGEIRGLGVDLPAMEEKFRKKFYFLEMRDRTHPARELWEKAGTTTMRGLFLREMKEKYDAAQDDAAREQVILALRYGLAAMDGREME